MLLNKSIITMVVTGALQEDAAQQDITTTSFIPQEARIEARIVAKQEGVVCGMPLVMETFKSFDKTLRVKEVKKDGEAIKKDDVVCYLKGRARSILSCERVALNFLSYLSGISSQTQLAVRQVKARGIKILDTRKTTPLYRAFEKYAVLMGGGNNHRFDLAGQYLVKDNHIFILKKIKGMDVLSAHDPNIPFEIEVEDCDELKKACAYDPDIVLLDNFSPQNIRKAIRLLDRLFQHKEKKPLIEISGGITLENISSYAIKGVNFISLGALTHSATALDFSLEIVKVDNK